MLSRAKVPLKHKSSDPQSQRCQEPKTSLPVSARSALSSPILKLDKYSQTSFFYIRGFKLSPRRKRGGKEFVCVCVCLCVGMETGIVVVEKVCGKSTVTRCFSKYPLKFIVPNKVGCSKTDSVWIYSLTYGGGIVSGDSISCKLTVGDGCTAALTTQASTKVYKAVGSKCSEQFLEVRIGSNALLAVIPDPVTCFATARYSQKQVFRVASDSSLVIVDWITSGRFASGEKWDFGLYKSTNQIFLEDDQPLFLDSVLLEAGSITSIAERMQDYQVIAMIIFLGPKLKPIQDEIQDDVKRMMSDSFRVPSSTSQNYMKVNSGLAPEKPPFIASCSAFGPKDSSAKTSAAEFDTL
ncbi:urease accessory protein D isoform X2 [Macadamia integrifolia]|uniref:urease accessory protein D isoform X2 n=1 Tax=Macadamia integrifolia TaxID=60698 RepID=UPI001C53158B|nr:urease accessory protein D isoform X2 [Macadamia integrifolia]